MCAFYDIMEATHTYKGDVWQQVVEYGASLGMSVRILALDNKIGLGCPNAAGYFDRFSALLEPNHMLYIEKAFYDNLTLSWADRLNYVQISISTNKLQLQEKDNSVARIGEVSYVVPDSLLMCAWCLEESQMVHIISPWNTCCKTFLQRKQTLQDVRVMWLWWSQVARQWLHEDVVGYGGRLLVKLARG